MAYLSVDLDSCRRAKHTLRLTWSDKTPMKGSLMCVTCTLNTHMTAYAAYGDDTKSWGQWREKSNR